ncbi:MAG: hypothetical protein GX070_05585, partial [Alcaligenaceae bacterium]|nr:hypothetical protein [Alcaligenaceae bacterium]
GIMGVGSGIVYDSNPAEEYEECHWKARFLQNLPVDFTLFETMLYDQGQCALLETHIARLQRSAQDLGFHFDETKTRQDLQACFDRLHKQNALEGKATTSQPCRIKVILHDDATLNIQAAALDALAPDRQTVVLATQSFPNHDVLRRYKTSHRQAYDAQMQHALAQGAFDSLCFNENGYLLEGARSSIFVFHQNQWLTPGLDLDILHSVMRETILQNPEHWLRPFTPANTIPVHEPLDVKERLISMEQLANAQKILAVNALRGIIPVSLLKLNDFKDNLRK